jgi:hypothetical protein
MYCLCFIIKIELDIVNEAEKSGSEFCMDVIITGSYDLRAFHPLNHGNQTVSGQLLFSFIGNWFYKVAFIRALRRDAIW